MRDVGVMMGVMIGVIYAPYQGVDGGWLGEEQD